jgi:hypothetical protein
MNEDLLGRFWAGSMALNHEIGRRPSAARSKLPPLLHGLTGVA